MRKPLPELCFSTLPGTGDLICIKSGETGYYPSDWNTDDPAHNRELADYNNRRLGVSYAMEQAFLTGSMSGWDVPGADPQFHFDHAQYYRGIHIQGHIKDDVLTAYYPTNGTLYHYRIDGRMQQYYSPRALSPGILGRDSNVTILPDLICGEPLVQVDTVHSENGTYTLYVLSHCLTHETKEINAGYRIDMRMQIGGREIVMGQNEEAPAQFATWLRTPANDKDGPHNFYWGHYSDTRDNALSDFCDRAHLEYQHLMERKQQWALRKPAEPER